MSKKDFIEVYTDGSCKKTKIGGYGYIVVENNTIINTFIRREKETTNQRMELMALLSAYEYCKNNNISNGVILSDSSYCLNCAFDKWYIRWEKNNFINSKNEPVKNKDLWEKIIPFFKESPILLKKVPGHQDCYFNNIIDSLVTTISNNMVKDLTGEKFGKLTVLSLCGNKFTDGINTTYWLCQCECGVIKRVQQTNLISGNIKSCGSCLSERYEDLTNQQFGYLIPLEKIGKTSDNYALWKCKCINCGSVINVSSRLLKTKQISCGCIKSKGEERISKILTELKINFKREISFDDLIDEKPLKFDFGIYNQNALICLIEYQGIQHFSTSSGWNDKEHLIKLQHHDKLKREYCQLNNIPLIEIKYTDYDKLNLEYLRQVMINEGLYN